MSGMHRDRMKPGAGQKIRSVIRACAAILFNGYIAGFTKKSIFTGKTKAFCVPVLNCYSCPGALGACPIGSLQAVLGSGRFPFYVLGSLMLFGVVMGRLVCGLLCPFGLIQDLLHRIPGKKIKVPEKADRPLRYLKYVILLVFVIVLPAFWRDSYGSYAPWFCKYICSAGTLEGGMPLVLLNPELRKLAGVIFTWKTLVLAAVIIGTVLIPRFFCRYLCPLGAFYSLFNRFSMYRMEYDKGSCIGCGMCEKACPMAVKVTEDINCAECIRCGKCADVCPKHAICATFRLTEKKTSGPVQEPKENL